MKKNVYSKEFKEEAVKLVLEQGVNITQACTELGVSDSALRKWIGSKRVKGAGAFPGSGNFSPEEQKIRDLEKKVRVLEMERDILKKATAFFAKESL
jgi:transposase